MTQVLAARVVIEHVQIASDPHVHGLRRDRTGDVGFYTALRPSFTV